MQAPDHWAAANHQANGQGPPKHRAKPLFLWVFSSHTLQQCACLHLATWSILFNFAVATRRDAMLHHGENVEPVDSLSTIKTLLQASQQTRPPNNIEKASAAAAGAAQLERSSLIFN